MQNPDNNTGINHFDEEFYSRKSVIAEELRNRAFWFVRLRWWVPAVISAGALAGWAAGIEIGKNVIPAALFILAYNALLWKLGNKLRDKTDSAEMPTAVSRYTYLQVALDFTAIFYLIHLTGGAASPFIFFFIFHIIFASILLRPKAAYAFAAIASAGMPALAALEYKGILCHHYLDVNHSHINLSDHPAHMAIELFFFAISIFVTAFSTTAVVKALNKRILDLANLTDAMSDMNKKCETLAEERAWFMVQVAHNMRAPLAAVRSIIDVMSEGYSGPLNSEQQERMDRISYRVEMMSKMVEELVTLARSRMGKQIPTFSKTDLVEVVKKTMDLFARQAEEKRIEFKLHALDSMPPVEADREMVEQAMDNLASNAIKYTRQGGTVKISVGMEGKDNAEIIVADTGIGIPEEEIENLFTDFFRASNAKELHEIGSGLGLSITKKFIELHGGKISVSSAPGRGSTFKITLPIVHG